MSNSSIDKFFSSKDWTTLKSSVKETVKAHIIELKKKNPDLSGYALLPGETYEVDGLYSVTCNGYITDENFEYCPDEWSNWHDEYPQVTPLIKKLNQDFKSIHQSDPDDYCMDDTEVAFIKKFHDTFLDALFELKEEKIFASGDEDIYVLIWLSDTDVKGIIQNSVEKLNAKNKVNAFKEEFKDSDLF